MQPEKLPPHNAEAEAAIVGSALVYGTRAIDCLGSLRVDDLFIPEHRAAWEAITAAAGAKGGHVDVLSVEVEIKRLGAQERFPGGWLTWAMAAAQKASVLETLGHLATMVRETAAARRLIERCAEWQARAYSGSVRWEELLTDARNGVADLELCGGESATVHIYDAIKGVTDEIQRGMDGGEKPLTISTGIPTLDYILDDLEGGQVVVIAARPGCGKTALACNIAEHTGMIGIPSIYFSLEMATRRIARRILASNSKTSTKKLRGDVDYEAWKKIIAAAGRFERSNLFINDAASSLQAITGETRRFHARRVRGSKDKRCCVFIDYAQLAKVLRHKGGNREQEVAEISRGVKELSRDTFSVVFLLAQLSREAERRGGPPILADLRESGSLEQDADVILFPHREVNTEDMGQKNERGPMEIIVAKHRDGEVGSAAVEFVPEWTKFVCRTDAAEPTPHWSAREDE